MSKNSKEDLLNAIDSAFSRDNNQEGVQLLRSYANQHPNDAASVYRLANIEEQLGNLSEAHNAYLYCLKLQPKNWITYLHLGYLYELREMQNQAAMVYIAAEAINPSILHLWRSSEYSPQTRMRSQSAFKLASQTLTKLHKTTVGTAPSCQRIRDAIWTRTHDQKFTYQYKRQRPQIFYIPGLASQGFEYLGEKSWVKQVEAAASDIRREYFESLPSLLNNCRPYLDDSFSDSAVGNLAGSMNWAALDLYNDGRAKIDVLEHFPKTRAILEAVPLYALDQNPFEVFFSVLKSQQHIKAHYGQSNHSLTVHLPIHIPKDCSLRVADERKQWHTEKILAFDDTFDHEAKNDSDETRVVLIFSVWHPDLEKEEREAIKATFRSRHEYIQRSERFIASLLASHTFQAPK